MQYLSATTSSSCAQNCEGVGLDHAAARVYTRKWQEEPQAVAESHKQGDFRRAETLVALVQEVRGEVNHCAMELHIELDQADHSQGSGIYGAAAYGQVISHGPQEHERRHQETEPIAHVDKEAERLFAGVRRVIQCICRPYARPKAKGQYLREPHRGSEEVYTRTELLVTPSLRQAREVLFDVINVDSERNLPNAYQAVQGQEEGQGTLHPVDHVVLLVVQVDGRGRTDNYIQHQENAHIESHGDGDGARLCQSTQIKSK